MTLFYSYHFWTGVIESAVHVLLSVDIAGGAFLTGWIHRVTHYCASSCGSISGDLHGNAVVIRNGVPGNSSIPQQNFATCAYIKTCCSSGSPCTWKRLHSTINKGSTWKWLHSTINKLYMFNFLYPFKQYL